MVSRYLKYLPLAIVLASVMAFAVACGEDEEAATAVPAPAAPAPAAPAPAAPAPAAPAPVAPAPAAVAATAVPVLAAATAAPAVVQAAPVGKAPAHLKMAQGDDPDTMYCGESIAVASVMFGKAYCDGSIDFIQDELVGRLAISWSSNSDSTEWTYKLRKGVDFHDGDPFNAQALKAHLDFIRTSADPNSSWNISIYGKQVTGVEVLDDFSVRLTMDKSRPIWPLDETWWANGIANQRIVDEVGLERFRDTHMSGTGAFKFISWERLDKVEMEANRDWWGPESQTTPERVTVFNIPEAGTRLAALLTEEIDWLINPLTPQIEIIEASPKHRVLIREQYDVITMYLNWNRVPALKEKRLRQAISEAINYQAIVDDIYLGTATVLRNNLPTTSAYYGPDVDPYPKYDPENAKRLVAELKAEGLYNDEEISFLTARGVYTEDARSSQALVDNLQEAGINGVIEIVDSAIKSQRYRKQACEWDLIMSLPVDGYGDLQGWLWNIAGGRTDYASWCFTESSPGNGDWGDPDLNEWMRLGPLAEVMPVGPERDAAFLKALESFNKSYTIQGLWQLSFVYGISNEWDFLPDTHESTFIWSFKKR